MASPSMYFLVSCKSRSFGKTFVTMIIENLILPSVYFLMTHKITYVISHVNDFSPVCNFWWLIIWELCLKLLLQRLHENVLSPVWTLWWFLRLVLVEKCLSHWLHGNGFSAFSPVCILWCLIRLAFWLKLLLQWSHGNVFSTVCIYRCIIWLDFLRKHLLQWSHVNGFLFSVCILWCIISVVLLEKLSRQWLRENFTSASISRFTVFLLGNSFIKSPHGSYWVVICIFIGVQKWLKVDWFGIYFFTLPSSNFSVFCLAIVSSKVIMGSFGLW